MKRFLIGTLKWVGFVVLVILIFMGLVELLLLLYSNPLVGIATLVVGALLFLSVMVALAVSGWLKKLYDFFGQKPTVQETSTVENE